MARSSKKYDPTQIVDAPEHYELARGMGALTCGTWEHEIRSFEERVKDFCAAYPPEEPEKFCHGSLKRKNREFVPSKPKDRRARFRADDWRPGSIHDLLAGYGLKLRGAPPRPQHEFQLEPIKSAARRRNLKLRVLHGDIDVSPMDMDAAKAEELDRREKQKAAQDIREARQRMKDDLKQRQ